jgi:uncharacterized protein (DUF1501 family)
MISRRVFLRNSAVVLSAVHSSPFWSATASAQSTQSQSSNKKILVVLFQRGAADGLNSIVPYGDPGYYGLRPTIAIPLPGKPNGCIDLDGHFGLHPSLSALKDLWDKQMFAIVEATGSPDFSRSHFEAQEFMESGTSGVKTGDGWLNRAMKTTPIPASAFRMVSVGPKLPLTIRGEAMATSVNNLANIQVGNGMSRIFEKMYRSSEDPLLNTVSGEAFEMLRRVELISHEAGKPDNGAQYGRGESGLSLFQIARMIQSDLGVEAAFVEVGGWDHHTNESSALPALLTSLATSCRAFCRDLGDRMKDIVLVTMSEFGRTAFENGNGGTDHGHGNLMMLFGGPVRGGNIYGDWPGLSHEQLFQGRDLAVTTDFRDVLGEILKAHMGLSSLENVFPDYVVRKNLGFIRS